VAVSLLEPIDWNAKVVREIECHKRLNRGEVRVKRMTSIGMMVFATLALGCHSEKVVSSASETGSGSGQPQANRTEAAPVGPGGVAWVTLRDQREEAFSVEVPQGWKVGGGMFRYRIAYPRPTVDMTSPDGRINVLVGDATIPNYQTPAAYRVPGGQTGPPVAPFQTGDAFAVKYGMERFQGLCQSLQMTSSSPAQPKLGKSSAFTQATGGTALFSCTRNGEPMTAYVYAETMLVRAAYLQPANWYVTGIGSYLAPAAQAQNVATILEHSAESIAMNPQWTEFQKWVVAEGTRINLQTAAANAQATKDMNARQEKWKRMMAGETDDFNDILTGQTFAVDNLTGKTYEVPTGQGGQKWMNSQQNVLSSVMQPGPDYRPLETISHQ
jgi:hypothetical protein